MRQAHTRQTFFMCILFHARIRRTETALGSQGQAGFIIITATTDYQLRSGVAKTLAYASTLPYPHKYTPIHTHNIHAYMMMVMMVIDDDDAITVNKTASGVSGYRVNKFAFRLSSSYLHLWRVKHFTHILPITVNGHRALAYFPFPHVSVVPCAP